MRRATGILSLLALFGAFPPPAAAENVGTMTAYQTVITRNASQPLAVGAGIALGDRLRSNETGLGMIVFSDESSAKIGPNSSLTIDEFVYSPGSRSGTIGIGMSQGLARLYGGQVSKGGNMEVRTPHIVLGARGGIIEIAVEATRSLAILRAGRMVCNVGAIRRVVTNPGFACESDGSGLEVRYAGRDELARLDAHGDSASGAGVASLTADSACGSAVGANLESCRSRDGSLPGPVMSGERPRGSPLGSVVGVEEDHGECGYYGCGCDHYFGEGCGGGGGGGHDGSLAVGGGGGGDVGGGGSGYEGPLATGGGYGSGGGDVGGI